MFVSVGATPLAALRAFVLPHIFATAQICRGRPLALALGPIALLLLEVARSGWGSRDIARVLYTLPRRYDEPLLGAVRSLARALRRCDPIAVLERTLSLAEGRPASSTEHEHARD